MVANRNRRHFDYADRYYLDRIAEHTVWLREVEAIQEAVREQTPVFVVMRRQDYDTHPFFQQHEYHYWLKPVYANELYPERLILVYNHQPDSSWFIKNTKNDS